MTLQVVILAAGQGKRMFSDVPKVLHELAGKPLLDHVIEKAHRLSRTEPPIVIFGHQGHVIREALSHHNVKWIEQKDQLGTGHALLQALPQLNDEANVLVLYGDVPLTSEEMLTRLVTETPKNAIGMITAHLPNPTGYGRIVRDAEQKIVSIVEEKDATETVRAIHEVNSGIYFVPVKYLKKWLPTLQNKNAQGEYYLTDIITLAQQENIPIHSVSPKEPEEIFGVNDRLQLAQLERFYQKQMAEKLMRQGVAIADPNRLDIRGQVDVGRDVFLDVNVILEGKVVLGNGVRVGANTILRDTKLGERVEVKPHSMLDGAEVGSDCVIGPFARLRPGAVLNSQVHIGNFVEIKNSNVGVKTKINHLSYIGDSDVGSEVNIGAGTITCNYDGVNKHRTIIGDRVMVGSDSTLVAPVTLHDDVYVAAATTIRENVPAGALVFNKREEIHREGWVAAHAPKKKK